MARQKGFTLIEVMIVVVIVAILAAVAVPSYQDSIRKTRRADAKEALTRIAALQERFFFTNNNYANAAALGIGGTSQEGYYTIAVFNAPDNPATPAVDGCAQAPCFSATATPVTNGPQGSDTRCSVFSINQIGQKTARAADQSDTTEECW